MMFKRLLSESFLKRICVHSVAEEYYQLYLKEKTYVQNHNNRI